ncbi:ATP-binding protein [Candidatus Latescibacterota bacterium]
MGHTLLGYRYSRRKWARRGQALADFTLGALFAAAEHIGAVLVRIGKWSVKEVRIVLSRLLSGKKLPYGKTGSPKVTLESQVKQYEPLKGAKPGVRFNDIAGLDEAKREINLRMILPFLYPEQAAHYGIRRGGGLLLYGPPGTGKTMLAKAVATELETSFFHVRPSDILSGQVGQAEKNVAQLFETIRREEIAVLFIDEIESLIPSRRKNGSTIMLRVISQILGEVDGLTPREAGHTLLLIGATNELGMIDSAMLRPGRFDTKIFIGLPNSTARTKLLENALCDKPVAPDLDIPQLVTKTEGMTGAEIVEFVNRAADKAFLLDVEEDSRQTLKSDDFQ